MTELLGEDLKFFNHCLKSHFANRRYDAKDVNLLFDSIDYSLFSGGKRFRPQICFSVARALGLAKEKVMPWAMAIECIHTYSLIHDDLPCMDNDVERRGVATNHIKFSEDVALLAGDALLTESFKIVADNYPQDCATLVSLLSEASGLNGMIRGQILDIGKGQSIDSLSDLINLHELKTGQLISLCFQGLAILSQKNKNDFKNLGLMLGLAFQVKDDLLDELDNDKASFISFLGAQGTKDFLASLSEKIHLQLVELSLFHPEIKYLIDFNLNREV
jgi:geranylgeranyl diphosphate synthase, type II